MMTLRDDALVLRRIPYGETSLVVHFFTRFHGLLTAMARGARGVRSAHRAALASVHTLSVNLRMRGLEGMGTLLGADILHGRHRLTSDPLALAAAQVAMEAVYRGVAVGDGNEPLFIALQETLDGLDAGSLPAQVLAKGLGRMLATMGYGFNMKGCHRCGGEGSPLAFSWNRGEMLCHSCCRGEGVLLLSQGARLAFAGEKGGGVLSADETALLYRLAVFSLEKHGGGKLVADSCFRHCMGW